MYICKKCLSDDIEIEVVYSLKTHAIVITESLQDLDGADCYCNDCGEWTSIEEIEENA